MDPTSTNVAPWKSSELERQVLTFPSSSSCRSSSKEVNYEALLKSATFHIEFLEHHLGNAIFPSAQPQENPPCAFGSDPSRQYLHAMVVSAKPPVQDGAMTTTTTTTNIDEPAMEEPSPVVSGGKPVMNQSALHGFHVFEGLQLVVVPKQGVPEVDENGNQTTDYRLGYTFMEEKVQKLVDGIIRLRFGPHLLQANVLTRRLQETTATTGLDSSASSTNNRSEVDMDGLRTRFEKLLYEQLPYRRAQAEEMVRHTLRRFAEVNRNEMVSAKQENPNVCFYVRMEAQGGNRESIGQGPIGVGQSTLQILGQHASSLAPPPGSVVMNPASPPRLHSLVGPYQDGAFYPILNNRAVHHGNMGHQHLSAEMAQPHGADMLLCTAEAITTVAPSSENGGSSSNHHHYCPPKVMLESLVAETNFSNIGFILNDGVVFFPKSDSATYGLTQHVLRRVVDEAIERKDPILSSNDGTTVISKVAHEPLPAQTFLQHLEENRITGAFLLGSMPGVRPVGEIHVDETMIGSGAFTTYTMNAQSRTMEVLRQLYKSAYHDSTVWLDNDS